MADDSPGKVQALRAIFTEKNSPVMGFLPPGGKISNRPWKAVSTSSEDIATLKDRKLCDLKLGNKVLPTPDKNHILAEELCKELNGEKSARVSLKPVVGPKPTFLLSSQQRNSANYKDDAKSQNTRQRTFSDGQKSQAKSKAFGETIASFMFTNGASDKENDKTVSNVDTKTSVPPPIPKPRTSPIQNGLSEKVNLMNFCNSHVNNKTTENPVENRCHNVINSDNYICKSMCNIRRKELPPLEGLGPPPSKPAKPSHLKLPSKYSLSHLVELNNISSFHTSHIPPPMPPQKSVPQRPSYPCPPRPHTPPPLPPVVAPVIKHHPLSLREEIEELYEDTLLGDNGRPVSLIPEFTEEEENEELYHDAGENVDENYECADSPVALNLKKLPPPAPSEYLQPNGHGSLEELYQDADGNFQEEFYETMPCEENVQESNSPLYSNNKKEIEKLKREEEKRIRKEQKEREKREKEMEKLRKKFGLTGEEIPIDDGLVKTDSRGGKGDLPVKKGETVLILRMEGNPSGRWLVKNEKGKIGYVELTNIEVDPLSVKCVMSTRRYSIMSDSEELYCEAQSEEAIYEVTY